MHYKAKSILGCKVRARDGEVGEVTDLYVDDQTWTLRYFVVDTGGWLSGLEVLLVPSCMRGADPHDGIFYSDLTCQQVKDSPPVTADMPLSRQYEERLHDYYGWMPYWDIPLYSAPGLYVCPPPGGIAPYPYAEANAGGLPESEFRDALLRRLEEGDPHLLSFKEMKGYHIEATDGKIGHVTDACLDPATWRVTHFIVETRNWIPGKIVMIDIGAVRQVDWVNSKVHLAMTRAEIKASAAPEPEPRTAGDPQGATP